MRRTAAVVLAALLAPALAAAEPAGLDLWSKRHPQASRELGEWVKHHPQAAHDFFEWDSTHPERSREFVTWSIANPRPGIGAFIRLHPEWPLFNAIARNHRNAANTFMAWCRRHPRAAEALLSHPAGLRWAGEHLYAEYWQLKYPLR